jgi:hypothetical protein
MCKIAELESQLAVILKEDEASIAAGVMPKTRHESRDRLPVALQFWRDGDVGYAARELENVNAKPKNSERTWRWITSAAPA